MKIAIDVSPLKSGHRVRGVGSYTRQLVKALLKIDQKNEYLLVENRQKAADADLIHYPFFSPFFRTLPLSQKKPTVVTIHDLIPLVFPKRYPPGLKGKARFQLQKTALKSTAAVITDSQASKKDIVRYLGYPQEKIFVIYLAAGEEFRPLKDQAQLTRVRKKYSLPQKFVLYVGDVNYNKNVLGLAKACRKIKTPLVIAGKQAAQKDFDQAHPENQPLVQLIKEFGDDPRVLRLGFVPSENLVALYSLASLYCQPSFYEGFGLPVLEAMSCGAPVVASNFSSLPEICGQAAHLVDPRQGLAEGIKLVLNNPKLRKKLAELGPNQAKLFSWAKTAQETIKVYEKANQN
jgi:glycosyltransferase involved in cell wall biosynthesis